MFQRMIDDLKGHAGNALRISCLATAAAVALLVTASFLCAAGFIALQQRYGTIEACLGGAGVFFVVTLIAIGSYQAARRRAKARAVARAAAAPRSAMNTAMADPKLVALGIQIIRAIGIKRLVPMIAIGGVALGLLAASRRDVPDQAPAE
jgi:hypothetical protein